MIEAFGDFAADEAAADRPAGRRTTAPPRPTCSTQSAELGIAMLGVPEELGGAVEERSAVTSALITEALADGDIGLAFAAPRPRRGQRPRSASGATPTSRRPTCRSSSARTCPPPRSPCMEPGPLFDPFELDTKARARRRRVTSSTASSRSSRAPPTPSCSWSPPTSTATARRCSSSRPATTASPSSPSPRWASAPPPPRALRLDASGCRPARCSATATPTGTASASAGSPGAAMTLGTAPGRRSTT